MCLENKGFIADASKPAVTVKSDFRLSCLYFYVHYTRPGISRYFNGDIKLVLKKTVIQIERVNPHAKVVGFLGRLPFMYALELYILESISNLCSKQKIISLCGEVLQ